jgi:hypothetical protein
MGVWRCREACHGVRFLARKASNIRRNGLHKYGGYFEKPNHFIER